MTLYVENAGGRIAYDLRGEGPLVVCVPSMGDLRGEYRFLADQLAGAGYRVACMDVRGHGESSVGWADYSVAGVGSDIVALIRSLGGEPAIVIGTSMAAGAGVWAAAEAPELIAGLALIGPFVGGEGTFFSNLLYRMMFARPWGPAMWAMYYTMLYPSRKPADFAEYRAALQANLRAPGRMEALAAMIAASKSASESRLPRVQAPVLVLMGSKDPDFKDPEAEARRVAEDLRGTYTMLPGLGHYPHAEMPEAILPHILAFLSKERKNVAY